MQSTSQNWKGLFASGAALQTRAVIDGVVCEGVAPVIHRATMQDSLAVGNVVSASLSLTLRGAGSIPRSAAVVIETRLSDGQAVSEWLPQGTFYISRRMRDPVSGVLALECYDALLKANAVWVPSAGTWPRTLAAVTAELAALLGVALDSRTEIPTGAAYVMSEPAEGTTLRDALSYIAQAAGGNWIMSPGNRLRLVRLGESGATVDVVGVVGGIDVGQAGTVTGVRSTVDGDVTLTGDDTGIVVDVTLAPATAAAMAEGLIGLAYTPFRLTGAIYDPAAELGDGIRAGAGGEVVSALCSEQIAYGAAFRGDISAPDPGEVTDEYPYISKIGNEVSLLKADVKEIVENAIVQVDVEYAQNQSTTVAPTGGWSTDAPQWREGYYIWQRTATTTAGGTGYSEPTCISGRDGEDGSQGPQGPQGATGPQGPQGPQGVGIASVTEYYALNNSTTAPEDSAFSTGVKTPTASNRYVWNYELITYTDNSTSKTAKHIAATYGETGQAGATGNGISSVTDYYAVNNSTTAPADSAFSTTISLPTASNKYLWNYELITYTNDTTSKTGKRVIGTYGEKGNTGDQGQTGVGVSGVVEQYYLSTSSTTQTGGSWSTSQPQWASGKYIWTRSQVTWTNGTTTTTTPVLAQAINGANSTANAANSTANAANSTANAASAAVTTLDNALNQQGIFNRLTNNGAAQGMVLYNGQLYVNATYINAGYLSATRIQGGTLTLGGQNEAHGDMTIVDGSDNVVARIYSAGIAFADTSSLHGVKISRSGVVELSQISVYGSSAQLKAKILPLTSAGIAIADANSVSFASFSTGSSSIKSSFSVNDGSGGLLSVSGGHISLTDSNGSKLWMPGNGEVEVQAALSVTNNITAQHSGDVLITAKNAQTKATVQLDSAPSGNHGIYTNGYYNGSAYVASGAWMIYRNTSGNVIVNGTASGNVAKSGDTMTGQLTIKGSWPGYKLQPNNGSQITASFTASDTDGHGYFETWSLDGTKHDWYNLPNSTTNGGNYHILTDKSPVTIPQGGTGATTPDGACANIGAVKKSGDTMTGNLTVQHTGDVLVHVKNTNTSNSLFLYNPDNGRQGLYTFGYWNGSKYVESSKWLIYRSTDGNVHTDGVYIAEHQTDAGVIARCTQTGVNIWLENMSNGKQGLWSSGYWNGTAYVSSGKWLIHRNTAGHVIIDGNATTRENLGTYLYLDNATPATVYAKLSALNSNETVNIAMSQAVANYLTGTKVNIFLTGQVRKSSANEYRFMAYRTDGAKMYIWQATVTANGVSNVSGYQYSGTTI